MCLEKPLHSFYVKTDVIKLKNKPRRSSNSPRGLQEAQGSSRTSQDSVKKTAATEEDKFEFNKENAVDYAYVTIAAVYVLGNPSSMSRKKLSNSATETERNSDN